jgi:type IV pilus assembly protein PilM
MLFSKGNVVGLDIGSSCIKVVQLTPAHNGFSLKMLAVESLPPLAIKQEKILHPDLVASTISRLYKTHNIKNKNVVLSLAGPSVSIKKITLPQAPTDELADMVRWEADQYLSFDPTEAYMDFQILPSLPETRTVDLLLVVAKKNRVQALIGVAQEAGLTPVIIDSSALALENQYEINYHPDGHNIVALVDIGACFTNINILKAGSTVFVDSFLAGGDDITRSIQQELNLNREEAESVKRGKRLTEVDISCLRKAIQQASEEIVGKIEHRFNCFTASHPGETISRVLLSGGVALLRGFVRFSSQRLGRPVEVANPLKEIACNGQKYPTGELPQIAPQAAVGVGLALRRIGDKVYRPLVNI